MSPSAQEMRLRELLDKHRIRSFHSVGLHGTAAASFAMSVFDLERFLDMVVPPPADLDDAMFVRIIGRSQDLGPEDEPWSFELAPVQHEAGFEFRSYVHIPVRDVPEVIARLEDSLPDPEV